MITQPAPDILRNWPDRGFKLLIPGGWIMRVPSYRVEGPYEDAYIDWYRRLGYSFERAQRSVQEAVQACASAGFRSSLFASILYYAKVYSRMYPEDLRPSVGKHNVFWLPGYRPEVMQSVHVPGYRPSGRQPLAKKLLMEMAP